MRSPNFSVSSERLCCRSFYCATSLFAKDGKREGDHYTSMCSSQRTHTSLFHFPVESFLDINFARRHLGSDCYYCKDLGFNFLQLIQSEWPPLEAELVTLCIDHSPLDLWKIFLQMEISHIWETSWGFKAPPLEALPPFARGWDIKDAIVGECDGRALYGAAPLGTGEL